MKERAKVRSPEVKEEKAKKAAMVVVAMAAVVEVKAKIILAATNKPKKLHKLQHNKQHCASR